MRPGQRNARYYESDAPPMWQQRIDIALLLRGFSFWGSDLLAGRAMLDSPAGSICGKPVQPHCRTS
jgi:hypothetical protein